MQPACPYCATPLLKMPARKSKCKSCSRDMHVKSTPDDRTKRLMTDSEAEIAERLWRAWTEDQQLQRDAVTWGVDASNLRAATLLHGGDRKAALVALLKPRADAGEQLAIIGLAAAAPQGDEWRKAKADMYQAELGRLKDGARRGYVVGLQVRKPTPWHEAVHMRELKAQGLAASEIAVRTGCAEVTVERALRNGGLPPCCGPQCDELAAKVYSLEEALKETRLPCSGDCACTWRPLLRIGGKVT